MGVRRALLRAALTLTEYAASLHAPENIGVDGVELFCPACKTPWPCETGAAHQERVARLREDLARCCSS